MRARDFLLEAKPENLGQGRLNKLYQTYLNRDANEIGGYDLADGHQVATEIYNAVGPNYLIWAAKQYNQDQHFFLHDLEEWKNTLTQFATISKDRRVQIEKDINRYQNIDQLRTAISQASGQQETLGSKFYSNIISAIDKFVKDGQASWLYRSNEYSIYYPKTYEASNICSKFISTSVCTIMGETNFRSYSENGTLMYTITQDKLYNCYINTTKAKRSEGADEKNNHDYDVEWQFEHFPQLRPLIQKCITEDTNLSIKLLCTPEEQKHEVVKNSVEKDGKALTDVPDALRTPELCKIAVSNNGDALYFVPNALRTPELCKIAVSNNGAALIYVPRELRTYDICKLAVSNYGKAFKDVPDALRTPELCKIAVSNNGAALIYLPRELRTYDICKLAVSNYGYSLEVVPDEFKTPELCKLAVSNDGEALYFVPYKLKTLEICKLAVSNDERSILWVPDEIKQEVHQWLLNSKR